jgi:hypothetical protein
MDLLKEFNKQQDSDHIDLVILCWWIIRAVETETIAHIKGIIAKFHHHYQDSPKTLLEDIKSFANSFKADKDDLPLKQYYQQKLKELGDS